MCLFTLIERSNNRRGKCDLNKCDLRSKSATEREAKETGNGIPAILLRTKYTCLSLKNDQKANLDISHGLLTEG